MLELLLGLDGSAGDAELPAAETGGPEFVAGLVICFAADELAVAGMLLCAFAEEFCVGDTGGLAGGVLAVLGTPPASDGGIAGFGDALALESGLPATLLPMSAIVAPTCCLCVRT